MLNCWFIKIQLWRKYNCIFVLYFPNGSGLNNPGRICGRCKYLFLRRYKINLLCIPPTFSSSMHIMVTFSPDTLRLSSVANHTLPPNLMLRVWLTLPPLPNTTSCSAAKAEGLIFASATCGAFFSRNLNSSISAYTNTCTWCSCYRIQRNMFSGQINNIMTGINVCSGADRHENENSDWEM
jgi:hypothetical protein